ncbi:MAG: radical SAM protein [Candidatus Omnitrophota bacterium]
MMKYKHALFLNPYIANSATSAMMLFPPTGLEYVAASAKAFADKITLIDMRYEKDLADVEKLIDFIGRAIDFVGVTISWNRQLPEICALLNRIPETLPLVLGGFTATEKVDELFSWSPRINIICRGEGEETIKEILQGKPLEDILGISFRRNGSIVHNANRPLTDVNNIVSPDRSLRRQQYQLTLNNVTVSNLSFDTVLTSRGCPFNCKFCTFTLNPLGQKRSFSPRDVASVVEEISGISAKMVLFSDENFSFDAKRAEQICDGIIARGIKKRFIVQARIEIAKHPELLAKMVQAGFRAILIGIESPHDRILAQLNKGFDSAAVRKYFKVLRSFPLYYHGYFIYGNLTETEEEMLYIPEFAKEIGVDSISFLKLRIEKFSPLRELVEQTPDYHIREDGLLYSDVYGTRDLKKIGRKIKFAFYTPGRYMHLLKKVFFEIKFFTGGEILSFIAAAPRVLKSVLTREIEKGRLGDSLKRIFVSNK